MHKIRKSFSEALNRSRKRGDPRKSLTPAIHHPLINASIPVCMVLLFAGTVRKGLDKYTKVEESAGSLRKIPGERENHGTCPFYLSIYLSISLSLYIHIYIYMSNPQPQGTKKTPPSQTTNEHLSPPPNSCRQATLCFAMCVLRISCMSRFPDVCRTLCPAPCRYARISCTHKDF